MIIDGKKIAEEIIFKIKQDVAKLKFKPVFCDVLVGNDPVSLSYVKIKGRTAKKAGFKFLLEHLPENTTQIELSKKIEELNSFPNMCGLIIQLPLPPHINRQEALDKIDPKLDVDCLGSKSSLTGFSNLLPPTAAAVMEIIDSLPKTYLEGQFVIVGQGQLVGKPVTQLLKNRGLKVMVANSKTENLQEVCKSGDVLITATGRPGLFTKDFIKNGAAVIDAGTAEMDGGIVGDIDFESAKDVALYITPVPGGVGPITVARLLKNVYLVAEKK